MKGSGDNMLLENNVNVSLSADMVSGRSVTSISAHQIQNSVIPADS